MNQEMAWTVIGKATHTVLDDGVWKMWGFSGRPRYGRLINRWFRANWRVHLEERLTREIIVQSIASDVVVGFIPLEFASEVVGILVGANGMAETLEYATIDEAFDDLDFGVVSYVQTPVGEWARVALSRLEVKDIPDKATVARLLAGAAKLAVGMEYAIARAKTRGSS